MLAHSKTHTHTHKKKDVSYAFQHNIQNCKPVNEETLLDFLKVLESTTRQKKALYTNSV